MTNGTGLDLRQVQDSLQYFTHDDEIWIKLDAGTQSYMDRVNRSQVPLEKIIDNILLVGGSGPSSSKVCSRWFLARNRRRRKLTSIFCVCTISRTAGRTFRWCKFIRRPGRLPIRIAGICR
jgi:hypothetical protein